MTCRAFYLQSLHIYRECYNYSMKNTIIILLVLLGIYWLFAHADPMPLNHESMGLYEHGIHRIVGAVCLVLAAFFAWKWKFRNTSV